MDADAEAQKAAADARYREMVEQGLIIPAKNQGPHRFPEPGPRMSRQESAEFWTWYDWDRGGTGDASRFGYGDVDVDVSQFGDDGDPGA